MKEHNTNFYSLENIKETLKSCEDFLDGEEVYYHIGALRYAYEEIERLNNIIASLSIWLNNQYSLYLDDIDKIADTYDVVKNKLDKLKELKGSDKDEK